MGSISDWEYGQRFAVLSIQCTSGRSLKKGETAEWSAPVGEAIIAPCMRARASRILRKSCVARKSALCTAAHKRSMHIRADDMYRASIS